MLHLKYVKIIWHLFLDGSERYGVQQMEASKIYHPSFEPMNVNFSLALARLLVSDRNSFFTQFMRNLKTYTLNGSYETPIVSFENLLF